MSVRAVATGAEVARYRVSLRQVLADIPLGREAFDLLLVADDRGAVAAQQGDETLARNSLDGLAARDGAALTAARLWTAASLSSVRINARDYVLACRPVGLPHRTAAPAPDGEAGRAGLLFCGIASEERRRSEALDGAAEAVAGLWAVAAAVLLALPLVKLLLSGSRDPVRAADVRALGACSGLALLALGAAALAVPVTRALSARSDAALSSVASTATAQPGDRDRPSAAPGRRARPPRARPGPGPLVRERAGALRGARGRLPGAARSLRSTTRTSRR